MSTTTTNYGFTLPAVADPIDEDLWGTELNTNFTTLDTLLGARTASKYGALIVQNSTDNGFDTITSQGTSGTDVLVSGGADALPSFQSIAAVIGAVLFPVGSYYLNETVATNPNTLFGFGTWVAVTDRFIVGHGSTYTATGGAATVTLTTTELPAHTHSTPQGWSSGGALSSSAVWGTGNVNVSTTSGSTGSGAAFSIIPPYQAVYIWKRTA